jgi:DNA primase small subunit
MTKETYLKKLFQAYYRQHAPNFEPIPSLTEREFAFLHWGKGGMIRHIGFHDDNMLRQDLILNAPRHSYRSAAHYESPAESTMDKKNLKACDFVVDIDADHLPVECAKDHNYSICKQCSAIFPTDAQEACTQCGHTKFSKIVWICDECLQATKNHIYNLIDNFLYDDFGINPEEIEIYFSGHRGYHVHIETPALSHLNSDGRREIVDYITGQGFSFRLANFTKMQAGWNGFLTDQLGWPGKIAREFHRILKSGEDSMREAFANELNSSVYNTLVAGRQFLLEQLERKKNLWQIKGISEKIWQHIFDVLRHRIMSDVDVVVSIDLHRLIRLEGSIHGKSGFTVQRVDFDALKNFDPLRDALAFPNTKENTVKLQITSPICPKIRIGEDVYGPFTKDERIEIPLNAALFLLCKDVADLG